MEKGIDLIKRGEDARPWVQARDKTQLERIQLRSWLVLDELVNIDRITIRVVNRQVTHSLLTETITNHDPRPEGDIQVLRWALFL